MENSIMIAQDNRITMSRYDFTPIEKRCLYYVIKEVRRLYVDKELREDDKTYQDLFLWEYKIKISDNFLLERKYTTLETFTIKTRENHTKLKT